MTHDEPENDNVSTISPAALDTVTGGWVIPMVVAAAVAIGGVAYAQGHNKGLEDRDKSSCK